MSIEVFNGPYAASLWADAHIDVLIEAAVTNGAVDWEIKRTAWGIVFEVAFPTESGWDQYKVTEAMRNALNTVPDPDGILIYRGRSLDSGTPAPRRPRPLLGSGAAALALPFDSAPFELMPALFSDVQVDRRHPVRHS